jgi:hypothetical protein
VLRGELGVAVQSEAKKEGVKIVQHAQAEQLRTDGGAAAAGQQQQQQGERGVAAAVRMGGALEWLQEATALVEALSGVRISEVEADGLALALTTHADAPGAGARALLLLRPLLRKSKRAAILPTFSYQCGCILGGGTGNGFWHGAVGKLITVDKAGLDE